MTGAKRLDLPLVSQGAEPIDLLRRPALNSNENTANAPVFGQRYFAMASLRILLSDRASDITGLPTVTATAPVALDGTWNPGRKTAGGQIDWYQHHQAPTSEPTAAPGSTSTGTVTFMAAIPIWLQDGPTALTGRQVRGRHWLAGATIKNCTGLTATQTHGCTSSGPLLRTTRTSPYP